MKPLWGRQYNKESRKTSKELQENQNKQRWNRNN